MKKLVFAWDDNKAEENKRKHGVAFEEARSVFFDDQAIQFWDDSHSSQEDRFLMLGLSYKLRILLVVHCFRETDSTIRIISARKATQNEMKHYPGG
ncbi:BrnT family toxin [bacterium]|nr:BrnT family toxin [bacterium]